MIFKNWTLFLKILLLWTLSQSGSKMKIFTSPNFQKQVLLSILWIFRTGFWVFFFQVIYYSESCNPKPAKESNQTFLYCKKISFQKFEQILLVFVTSLAQYHEPIRIRILMLVLISSVSCSGCLRLPVQNAALRCWAKPELILSNLGSEF